MLEGLSLVQLNEWIDYAEREPFGEERADLRSAIIACVMANAGRGKSARRFKPSDFMPKFHQKVTRQTPDQMRAVLRGYGAAHNAATGKKRRNG